MGITYKIDADAGVIFTFAEGEIGEADLRACVNQIMADPLYTPNLRHLIDGLSAKFQFSGEEARQLASWNKQNRPTAITAFVIDNDAQGYIRMYLGWRDGDHNIFHDMESAREWLGLPPE